MAIKISNKRRNKKELLHAREGMKKIIEFIIQVKPDHSNYDGPQYYIQLFIGFA